MAFWNIFSRDKKEKEQDLNKGLEKTKEGLFAKIKRVVAAKSSIDDDFLDELEEILVTSDIGAETSMTIIERLRDRVARDKYLDSSELNDMLYEEVSNLLSEKTSTQPDADFVLSDGKRPYIILVVGVNGAGKTTTIGKLAYNFKAAGNKVLLGAADTFRAAAIEQLEEWARRADVPLVKQAQGADPAAVAYDTVASGLAQGADVVIIDTAGRLHNKVGLMNELTKIQRSISKLVPDGPNEVLLVLDGSTGQNAIEQARQFSAATHVTGLVVTKLDGTAKGGVVIGISNEHNLPVRYIGIGEKITDIQPFDKLQFVKSLFGKLEQ
ncbi:MAG: signal recognition particle-docking protein FtsY [Muribaculaceae bacterium]|nr:signal recognition particle-docking protein FtsY [Muribaculaceae bacterium]